MNDYEIPRGPILERARAYFVEFEDTEAMLHPSVDRPSTKRTAASSLYAAASQSRADIVPTVEDVLADSRSARAAYRHMVATTALYTLFEAKAASSGETPVRHGEGCLIRTERSRAEPNQFFVVVELTDNDNQITPPTCLIVCDTEDRSRRFPLPVVRDGIAQFIAEAHSDLMRMLGDPTTRIYLQ